MGVGGTRVSPGATVAVGAWNTEQIAEEGRSRGRYVRTAYDWHRPDLGEIEWRHDSKRVWDTIADPVYVFPELAKEAGPYGIRANCIIPGAINTELLQNYHKRIAEERGVETAVVEKESARNTALERIVEPREVTKMVMFLCSDDASAITGQMIRVCGGAAMG